MNSRNRRIAELDILRSVAIIFLFFHHSELYGFQVFGRSLKFLRPYFEAFILGAFIFLSGYLSSLSLRKGTEGGYFRYIKGRLLRIYPPYLVALILFILLLEVPMTGSRLIVHLLGFQILLAPIMGTPIFTLWFVGVILLFFYIFSFLQMKYKSNSSLGLAILLVYIGSIFLQMHFRLFEYRYFFYYPIFAIGIFCERVDILKILNRPRFYLYDKFLLAVIGAGIMAVVINQVEEGLNFVNIFATDIFILTSVLFVLSLAQKVVSIKVGLSLFSYISTSAFFAFLFHRPFLLLLTLFGTFPPQNLFFAYRIVIGTPVVLIVSNILQKRYDKLLERITWSK